MKVGRSLFFCSLSFIFVHFTRCQFLILPLHSLKRTNIDINNNYHPDIQHFLLPPSPKNFLNEMYKRTNFIPFSIGNPPSQVKAELSMDSSLLRCVSNEKFQTTNNHNFFTHSNTVKNTSYITINKDNAKFSLFGNLVDEFKFNTTDNLLNSYTRELSAFLDIYLIASFNDSSMVKRKADDILLKEFNNTFSFLFGMQIGRDPTFSNFLYSLKEHNLISSYDFKFQYLKDYKVNPNEDNDEIGKLIFGTFDELYDKKKYPPKYIRSTKLLPEVATIYYAINFTEIYIQTTDKASYNKNIKTPVETYQKGFFIFNQYLFTGDDKYKEVIEEEFFNKFDKDMCKEEGVTLETTYEHYTVLVCNKEKLEKYKYEFPSLKFYHKELNMTFEFDYDDLFKEYFDKVYFLVVFPSTPLPRWELGTIFLKKYELIFNTDSKDIKIYHPNEWEEIDNDKPNSNKGIIFLIIVEIILVVCVAFVAFYIGKTLNKQRKIRANELEDNYEYLNDKGQKENELKMKV